VGGGSVSGGDFEPDLIVLRGGDGLKRDIVVSTTWRTGFHPSLTSIYVGFRTAASATRGKDHVATLTERDALKRYLVDFPAIPTDQLARRTYAALDHQNPAGYSSLMMGGWDETRNLPARARHITAIRRVSEDFRDMDAVRALAKDGPVMLGFLHLDVPSVKPKLDPGDYFILWQNSYIPEPPPEEAEDEANPDEKPKKPAPKRAKPDPKKKPDPIPETFLFKRVGGKTLTPPVGFTDFLPAVQAAEQPLRMTPNPAKNTIDLQFPFPVKYKKDASFIVTLSLELAPGVVAQFK
jgi:hypothetical protein